MGISPLTQIQTTATQFRSSLRTIHESPRMAVSADVWASGQSEATLEDPTDFGVSCACKVLRRCRLLGLGLKVSIITISSMIINCIFISTTSIIGIFILISISTISIMSAAQESRLKGSGARVLPFRLATWCPYDMLGNPSDSLRILWGSSSPHKTLLSRALLLNYRSQEQRFS